MKKKYILLILLTCIATGLLAYSPHYSYRFPRHIDEWHHITETLKLEQGEYPGGFSGFRIGFHFILLLLSKITDLVLIYRFLPASWVAISALALFYVVYKKAGSQFTPAILAMIFFASIKSNVNITGLWFFNPLTFSIPFIYLYIYFFTEGIERQNKKFLLISLAITILLLPTHAISVLFAVPFLLIYSLLNIQYIKREWKFFTIFLLIPLIGTVLLKFIIKVPWHLLKMRLFQELQFKQGWGVLEIKNSPFELYSLIGYILAITGFVLILINRQSRKKYLAYALWPAAVLISIIIYRIKGVSFLSPYQRNLYYFALSLPLLSALGADFLARLVGRFNKKLRGIFLIILILFTFKSYWKIPRQIDLYQIINEQEYQTLLFLKDIPEKSPIMAMPRVSAAIYAVSGHEPVATYFFYGQRKDCEKFFLSKDCKTKQKILKKYGIKYILSKSKINCRWPLIYQKKRNYIYKIR